MPYTYLTFSDLYEEEQRASAPPSPISPTASLPSPVFLLPTNPAQYRSQRHRHLAPTRSPTQLSASSVASSSSASSASSVSSSSTRKLAASLRKSLTLGSGSAWKKPPRKSSWRTAPSADSTPCSSCSSSIDHRADAVFLSTPTASPASSANTSPSISRTNTKMSDYEAMLDRTRRQEAAEELQRQREIQAFFARADAETSLRRF
ncbi:uncharacterized protein PFL1_00268 [Pseudozyma flocculosa PF-1]|uniref:Uncharacterized protein n=1 Tax=Pseudozyma flocculosa TaxID=84751 RepID=A0A5C3ET25_9BASI|nr:uncharacterized protein PFL1_00268 [Pseudozyma flocculosa PF-1]EPQ32070.1 hypothetical protein PFL1_00268 [Pseudozyma flocculosa PF-1]SPO35000.1 uncharacterized protein PSFLO_00471 [Pseudozyma flocculosa]